MARRAARAGRAAGLRLQPRRQLLHLAGLRPRLRRRAAGPLPPYLRREHFDAVRSRADRVEVLNRSITEYLAGCPAASRDRYVLLDAQDWMTDAQLNALWAEITRTARPGARVIFRTAAEPSLLPGRARSGAAAALALRGGGSRATSPRATARRSMAASISTSSRADGGRRRRRGPDGPALSPAAPFLRRHAQVLSAGPRPPDRGARAAAGRPGARDRLRHRAQPGGRGARLAGRAVLRHRHLGRDAGHGAPGRRTGRARARASRCTRRRHSFDPAWLFGVPALLAHLLLLQPVDDPGLARRRSTRRWAGCRRAASCTSSISAASSGCHAGSAPACGCGWPSSMSARATGSRPSWRRAGCGSWPSERPYGGYAQYADLPPPRGITPAR